MTKKTPSQETPKHAAVGRPTDFRPAYSEQARKLCLLGATDNELADFFGIQESTLNLWKHAHPAFMESITCGKQMANANVAERLYLRACGYEHQAIKIFMPAGAAAPVYAEYTERYPPDTQAASLWLRNREPAKWRDKIDHEHSGRNGGPIEQITTTTTPEEAAKIYRERMKGGS